MPTVIYASVGRRIVSEKRGAARSFYGADPLGSTVAMYDLTGTTSDTFSYWPYGEVRASTGSTSTPFKFCGTWGYYRDTTGRLYVRARHYRENLARWKTRDPIWPRESAFQYTGSMPFSPDPSGLKPKLCGGTCCADYDKQFQHVEDHAATTICCNGKPCICVKVGDSQEARDCWAQHEEVHMNQPGYCSCPKGGVGKYTPREDWVPYLECEAHSVSAGCFYDCFTDKSRPDPVKKECLNFFCVACSNLLRFCKARGLDPMHPWCAECDKYCYSLGWNVRCKE